MAIYIDTTKIANTDNIYIGLAKVKKVYATTNISWEKYVGPLTLFEASGAPHPKYAYPYSYLNRTVTSNLLSEYSHVDVDITYSYLDSYNMIEVWDWFTYDFYSYGSIGAYVPGITVSFSSSGYTEVQQTGNGPDGGFLETPKIMRIIAFP